jgi:hypothetical protein
MYTDKTIPKKAIVKIKNTHYKVTFIVLDFLKDSQTYVLESNTGVFRHARHIHRDNLERVHKLRTKKVIKNYDNPLILSDSLRELLNRNRITTQQPIEEDHALSSWTNLTYGVHAVP